MTISHNWIITNSKIEHDIVVKLDWELISVLDSGEHVRSYGSVNLKGDVEIPLKFVDEDIMVMWLHQVLGEQKEVLESTHVESLSPSDL